MSECLGETSTKELDQGEMFRGFSEGALEAGRSGSGMG